MIKLWKISFETYHCRVNALQARIDRSSRIIRVPATLLARRDRTTSRIFAQNPALRKYAETQRGDGAISEVKHDVMQAQINALTDKINIYIRTPEMLRRNAYHIFIPIAYAITVTKPCSATGDLENWDVNEKSFFFSPTNLTSPRPEISAIINIVVSPSKFNRIQGRNSANLDIKIRTLSSF